MKTFLAVAMSVAALAAPPAAGAASEGARVASLDGTIAVRLRGPNDRILPLEHGVPVVVDGSEVEAYEGDATLAAGPARVRLAQGARLRLGRRPEPGGLRWRFAAIYGGSPVRVELAGRAFVVWPEGVVELVERPGGVVLARASGPVAEESVAGVRTPPDEQTLSVAEPAPAPSFPAGPVQGSWRKLEGGGLEVRATHRVPGGPQELRSAPGPAGARPAARLARSSGWTLLTEDDRWEALPPGTERALAAGTLVTAETGEAVIRVADTDVTLKAPDSYRVPETAP